MPPNNSNPILPVYPTKTGILLFGVFSKMAQTGDMPEAPIDLEYEIVKAIEIAEQVGAELMSQRFNLEVFEKSSITDMVTNLDRWSEATIVDFLAANFPADGVLGEEGAAKPATSGRMWVIDPIDGTTNFVYGLPGWCISIALVNADDKEPLVGVVHVPSANETYFAKQGQKAFVRDSSGEREITPSNCTELGRALIGTGFGYTKPRRESQARVLSQLLPAVRDIRRIGSCAIDLCLVASGALDAYYERGVNLWDYAAGALIAERSGVLVTGLNGNTASPELILAANPELHEQLDSLLTSCAADSD